MQFCDFSLKKYSIVYDADIQLDDYADTRISNFAIKYFRETVFACS